MNGGIDEIPSAYSIASYVMEENSASPIQTYEPYCYGVRMAAILHCSKHDCDTALCAPFIPYPALRNMKETAASVRNGVTVPMQVIIAIPSFQHDIETVSGGGDSKGLLLTKYYFHCSKTIFFVYVSPFGVSV